MPITEDPTTTTPAPQTPPAFDYNAFSSALTGSLQRAGLIGQQQAPQQPVSQFQEAVKALAADSDDDSKENLSTLVKLFDAHRSDLSRAQQDEVAKVLMSERVRQARQLLDAEINRVTEADEDLARYSKAVKKLVEDDFDNSPEFENDRRKVLAGEADATSIRKLVNKYFTELAGGKKEPKGGVSGMKNDGNPSQSAAAQAAKANGDIAFKDLNEPQRNLYYAILAEKERVGLKRLGQSKEEAEAEALKRASTKFR